MKTAIKTKIAIKAKTAIKVFLKRQGFIIHIIARISEWQSSTFSPLRWVGSLLSAPLFFLLKDRYYKLITLSQKNNFLQKEKSPGVGARFLPEKFFVRVLTRDESVSRDEYLSFLSKTHLKENERFEWAQTCMGFGRLDLALVGFHHLIDQAVGQFSLEIRLKALRHLGIVYFLLGKNTEANHYWDLTGKLRRILLKPSTPRGYRILGPGWNAAFGHIGMLDYYVKYLKLYAENEVRVVAPWPASQIPGKELLDKFAPFGITAVDPEALEEDYNIWAMKNGFSKWGQLEASEKAALVDEFWEYDFGKGEILSVTLALARIQQEWEQAGRQPLFSLTQIEREWIANYLSYLGIPKDAWYVCLHVREAGFHKEWNSLYPSMRDADISDYSLAIEKIVNAGGWVLRMGDSSMKPLPPMRNVIDYAHSPFKTSTADILLAASCRFILGTNSGFVNVCAMYNVPCALTNWVPIGWPLWMRQDLMIPKLFRDKKSGHFLTLEEIFEKGIAFLQNWDDLPSDIELIANTPEDLAEITMEMMVHCDISAGQVHASVGASESVEDHYKQIAKRYGSYTGSRLARAFVKKYTEVFSAADMEVSETNENDKIRLVAID